MDFLKCNNCGHLNEVKTEYLTFCKNCNKVLKDNYQDWIKYNPDKSFEDYKLLICTTEIPDSTKSVSKSPKRIGLKYWIGFFVMFAILFTLGQLGGEKIAGFFKKPGYDKVMMEIASELNKTCPMMVDNATRLDNSIALPYNVFQYNYTITTIEKDSVNVDNIKDNLEPRIINDVKTNPGMKFMRDKKVTVNYSYKDRSGAFLFTISVKPEQYN